MKKIDDSIFTISTPFDEGFAELLRGELLASRQPWERVYLDSGRVQTLPETTLQSWANGQKVRLNEYIYHDAKQGGFQFSYRKHSLVDGYRKDGLSGFPSQRAFLEKIASREWIERVSERCNEHSITSVDAQATLYRPGDFLTRHTDAADQSQERVLAYVYSLAKDWRTEWGGTLQIMSEQGDVVRTIVPQFNTLTLFSVPQWHCVTQVATYAPNDRISITGWFTR